MNGDGDTPTDCTSYIARKGLRLALPLDHSKRKGFPKEDGFNSFGVFTSGT